MEWHRGRETWELLLATLVARRGTRLAIEEMRGGAVATGGIGTAQRSLTTEMTRDAAAMGVIGKDWSMC